MSGEAQCIVCAGRGRRSTWVNELQQEIEGDCPDCDGTGRRDIDSEVVRAQKDTWRKAREEGWE